MKVVTNKKYINIWLVHTDVSRSNSTSCNNSAHTNHPNISIVYISNNLHYVFCTMGLYEWFPSVYWF
jgi:hypothetical protein